MSVGTCTRCTDCSWARSSGRFEAIAFDRYDTLSFRGGEVIVHTITTQDTGAILRFLQEES